MIDIEKLTALREKSARGVWEVRQWKEIQGCQEGDGCYIVADCPPEGDRDVLLGFRDDYLAEEDAEYITYSHNALPELLENYAKMVECLEFYADCTMEISMSKRLGFSKAMWEDKGKKARNCLQELGEHDVGKSAS